MTDLSSSPVFLIPQARTGGTLLVTMLDAHPDLAMSYEIYPHLLMDEDGAAMDARAVREAIEGATPAGEAADQTAWIKGIDEPNLRTFLFRARRAGLDVEDIVDELARLIDEGFTFESLDGRLEFTDRLMKRKAERAGKSGWGGKMLADPAVLHARHPEARFFLVLRDGRDMAASMLHTGSFNTTPARAAEQWVKHIQDFRGFVADTDARAFEVRYEALIADPSAVLEEVCGFLGVAYDGAMLAYHQRDLALFKNPYGHLSHKQLAEGLNDSSVGRWRRDLSDADARAFMDVAGELMAELGYA